MIEYSGLNLNQDKATKPQTVQIVRQGKATPYWFKVNPLYLQRFMSLLDVSDDLLYGKRQALSDNKHHHACNKNFPE